MTVTTDAPVAASTWSADELHVLADLLAAIDTTDQPVALLDQLDALQRIKAAAAAAQVLATAAFADAAEAAEDLPSDGGDGLDARCRSVRRWHSRLAPAPTRASSGSCSPAGSATTCRGARRSRAR
jgi:hypothetical protein